MPPTKSWSLPKQFNVCALLLVPFSFYLFFADITLPSRSEWDTCATHVIVEEAGGFVLRYDGSGERGMAGIAPLLEGAAGASEDAEGSRVGDLRLSYNKSDLSSPHCLFLGRCEAI